MKVLVAGWFSFEGMNTTAGDLLARDLACEWVSSAGRTFDVAGSTHYPGDVDWHVTDPAAYADVVFVCGPFRWNDITKDFLEHFAGCHLVGLNLSMLEPIEIWNPFDLLFERDSTTSSCADITFLSKQSTVPVVGVVLVHAQPQYKERALHQTAHRAIRRLIDSSNVAAVSIDTCLDNNEGGLRTPKQVESLIARMDVVVTTRLHGTVLSLKNGVPVLAVDPIAGGAKIVQQARAIEWPVIHQVDHLSDEALRESFDFCLTAEALQLAGKCRERAENHVRHIRDEFIQRFGLQWFVIRETYGTHCDRILGGAISAWR